MRVLRLASASIYRQSACALVLANQSLSHWR